jgi:stalled ribosome alternative rescue factor ArfA
MTTTHVRPDWRAQQVAALRDGRKNRATRFQPKKGKGSYTRKTKHGKGWQ